MAHAAGEVHEPALAEHIQRAPVRKRVADDVLSALFGFHGIFPEPGNVDLAVEMAGVREDRLVLHDPEMPLRDDVLAAGHRDEDVASLRRLVHRHDRKAVHGRVQRLEGVDLGDDDVRAHALGPHRGALAAPAVAGDDHGLARDDQVRRVHDRGPDRLAGPVLVVVVVLRLRVVDRHHRAGKDPLALARLQAVNAGRGLLAAADEAVRVFSAFSAEEAHKVAAVVDDEVRMAGEGLRKELLVLFRGDAVFSERLNAHLRDRRRDVILRRERVAAGEVDFRAALLKDES